MHRRHLPRHFLTVTLLYPDTQPIDLPYTDCGDTTRPKSPQGLGCSSPVSSLHRKRASYPERSASSRRYSCRLAFGDGSRLSLPRSPLLVLRRRPLTLRIERGTEALCEVNVPFRKTRARTTLNRPAMTGIANLTTCQRRPLDDLSTCPVAKPLQIVRPSTHARTHPTCRPKRKAKTTRKWTTSMT